MTNVNEALKAEKVSTQDSSKSKPKKKINKGVKVNNIKYIDNLKADEATKERLVDAKAPVEITIPEGTATQSQHPSNWDMVNDVLVFLKDDVMLFEKKLVVKGPNKNNPDIVDTEEELNKVKSYIKFGEVISTGSNRQVQVGDIIAANIQGVKGVDFAPGFATVQNYAIISKLRVNGGVKPTRKNLLGRIIKGFCKWVGCGNVHK